MSFSGLGKRVFGSAMPWGRRPPVAPELPSLVRPASVAVPVAAPAPAPSDDALSATMRAAEERRRQVAREIRAARNLRSADAVEAFLASVRHLPLFSGTATQLIRTAGQEKVSAAELVRLISTDAGLVAHLLRIVNSPFFGFARRLATVGDALAVLGVDHVRRTVTAAALQRPLKTYLHDSETVRGFWRHELLCAALARHLATRRGVDGELAYMAGLMHDVGRLAMLMQYPAQADVLLHVQVDDDHAAVDREFDVFGFDHAQAGGALLEQWGLPPEIVLAAREHGDEFAPDDVISACVWKANVLTHAMGDVPQELEDVQQPWMIEIGLTVNMRRRILDEIRAFESDAG